MIWSVFYCNFLRRYFVRTIHGKAMLFSDPSRPLHVFRKNAKIPWLYPGYQRQLACYKTWPAKSRRDETELGSGFASGTLGNPRSMEQVINKTVSAYICLPLQCASVFFLTGLALTVVNMFVWVFRSVSVFRIPCIAIWRPLRLLPLFCSITRTSVCLSNTHHDVCMMHQCLSF